MNAVSKAIPVLMGFCLILWASCQNRHHTAYKSSSQQSSAVVYDTSYIGISKENVLDNRSDVQFCKAVQLLKAHRNLEASIYIRKAVNTLQEEGSTTHGELKEHMNKAISKLVQMADAAKRGRLAVRGLSDMYHSAEWMVAHYEVEEWEKMPAYETRTNLYFQKTLQDIQYKLTSEEKEVKEEGEQLIKEGYVLLKGSVTMTEDTLVLTTHKEADKIKSFIKKQISD